MENRSLPIGFIIKQVNNVYEKDLNERLKKIGITSSQCAVLDYLFHTSKDEVSQRDVEKNLNLKNPTVTGILTVSYTHLDVYKRQIREYIPDIWKRQRFRMKRNIILSYKVNK